MRRKARAAGSWQLKRLSDFAKHEREEAAFYEMCYEKIARKIPYRVLSVMIFFLKEEYVRKPGSLVTVYRVSHGEDPASADFEKRYEIYYLALQERGFV